MKVEYLSPDELREYPGNAKIHTPEQVKRIAASIKAFGWQQPIVIDKGGTVIIGHGRLYAARELMLDSVPVVRADDLTEDQVKALRLADNQTAQGDYDFAKLEEELAALDIAGFDMEQFGFDNTEIDFPENLDADNGYEGQPLACKITFDSYPEYSEHETEIKEFAESIGAKFSVVKA